LDIIGLLTKFSQEIGRFFKHNFQLWLGLIRNPVEVLKQVDLNSDEVLYHSLGLAAFVYLVCLAIALPPQFTGDTPPGLPTLAAFVFDAITQFLGFGSVGLALLISGRVLGARTRPTACFSTGFLMTAAWPFLQLYDWVPNSALQESLTPEGQLALFGAVFMAVIGFALYWAAPIVAYVHKFGRARAILATFLQLFLIGAIWFNFLQDRFPAFGL